MTQRIPGRVLAPLLSCILALCAESINAYGQTIAPPGDRARPAQTSMHELESQISALRGLIAQMQDRMDQVQSHTAKLESELQETRSQLAAWSNGKTAGSPSAGAITKIGLSSLSLPQSVASDATSAQQDESGLSKLEEDEQLLEGKVNDQYQTKVESASKYRVRLSGIALLNLFANRGGVENFDVPTWARPLGPPESNAGFGATVRQSMIGLDVSGPELAGAKTSGEIQIDFFGAVPASTNGITAGGVRMRTATARMDWKNTSLIAGQDVLFFSPLSPTSYASLADPALSYSGNLWTWTPQIRIEHQLHISESAGITLQGGILDPLTGELPNSPVFRSPQAGEKSGQPAYASRAAWTQTLFGKTASFGVGGYYSRQNWGFHRMVDGWAGTADWELPLGRWFTLSGEFYRGRAIGGLSGGLGRSVLYNGALDNPFTGVRGLDTVGGWGQVGFRPTERLEFNGAFGADNPLASDFHYFSGTQSYISSSITRNHSAFTNVIYRPRSNLILALEYRRLWTFQVTNASYTANQINLGAGVLF